jgi:hypothetical protein
MTSSKMHNLYCEEWVSITHFSRKNAGEIEHFRRCSIKCSFLFEILLRLLSVLVNQELSNVLSDSRCMYEVGE